MQKDPTIVYECSNGHFASISDIYFCGYCRQILCKNPKCSCCEISILKCSKCQSTEIPVGNKLCNNCYSCPLCNTILRIAVFKEEDVEKYEYHCEHCTWKSRNIVSGNSRNDLEQNISEKLNNNTYTTKFNDAKETLIEKYKEQNKGKEKQLYSKEVIKIPEFKSSWSMEDLMKKIEEKEKKEIKVDRDYIPNISIPSVPGPNIFSTKEQINSNPLIHNHDMSSLLPIPLLRTPVIDRYCRKCNDERGKKEYLVKNEQSSNRYKTLESGYKYLPIVRLYSEYMKSTNMFILTIENPENLLCDLNIKLSLISDVDGWNIEIPSENLFIPQTSGKAVKSDIFTLTNQIAVKVNMTPTEKKIKSEKVKIPIKMESIYPIKNEDYTLDEKITVTIQT